MKAFLERFLFAASIQGVLSLMGFGALTWMFIKGSVEPNTYVPLVALMIGFWFGAKRPTSGP